MPLLSVVEDDEEGLSDHIMRFMEQVPMKEIQQLFDKESASRWLDKSLKESGVSDREGSDEKGV